MRLITVILALVVACGTPGPGPVVGSAVIDCTVANQDQIQGLLAELTPLVTTGSVDWQAVYARAKGAGSTIGGCVLAQLVQSYLGNRSAPPSTEDGWTARETLERFRASEAGGATFHVKLPDGSTGDL
jgi:hypothetical protein